MSAPSEPDATKSAYRRSVRPDGVRGCRVVWALGMVVMPLLVSVAPAVGQVTEEADSTTRVEDADGDGPRSTSAPELRFTRAAIG